MIPSSRLKLMKVFSFKGFVKISANCLSKDKNSRFIKSFQYYHEENDDECQYVLFVND